MSGMRTTRPDPPITDRCAVCRKPLLRTRQQRRYAGGQIDSDPFCSSRCCRVWYGTALPETSQAAARLRAATA
jgi:hypothetical protein